MRSIDTTSPCISSSKIVATVYKLSTRGRLMMAPAAGERWTATVTVMAVLLSLVSFTHASSASQSLYINSIIVAMTHLYICSNIYSCMNHNYALLFTDCISHWLTHSVPSPHAVLLPQSLIVGLNNELLHVFNCTVTGADIPDVQIGGLPFSNGIIQDRGITVITDVIDADTGSHAATISVPATIENNMTSIQCIALNLSAPSVLSPIAMFLVQGQACSIIICASHAPIPGVTVLMLLLTGLLDAPSTRFVPINESYLSFEWKAPFTLDITDVDPDIQFYTFQESLTGISVNVTEVGDFVFPTVAVTVEFSVSAWNVVGEGATASATHQPCTLSEGEWRSYMYMYIHEE